MSIGINKVYKESLVADESSSDSQQLWDMHIETGGEMQARQQAESAAIRQAVYDYVDSRGQYGSNRSLYSPEGRYEGTQFRYQPSLPVHSPRFRGVRRQSPSRGSRYSGGYSYGNPGHSQGKESSPWGPLREWVRWLFGIKT